MINEVEEMTVDMEYCVDVPRERPLDREAMHLVVDSSSLVVGVPCLYLGFQPGGAARSSLPVRGLCAVKT